MAFWMFLLNFPSSVLTGMVLNQVQWTAPTAWQVWWPFFFGGMAQWSAAAAILTWIRSRNRAHSEM